MTAHISTTLPSIHQSLSRRQQAARLLWREGHPGSSYSLTRQLVLDLIDNLDDSEVLTRHREELETLARTSLPPPPGEIDAERAEWLEQALVVLARIKQQTPEAAKVRRLRLYSVLAVLACSLGFGGWLVFQSLNAITTKASEVYNGEFPARLAMDGVDATEWLLPEGKKGWLDLEFSRPRNVSALTIRNSHNRHHADRATKELGIEAFFKDKSVFKKEIKFDKLVVNPEAVRVELPNVKVSRIRLDVRSHHHRGAGLAEVTVE